MYAHSDVISGCVDKVRLVGPRILPEMRGQALAVRSLNSRRIAVVSTKVEICNIGIRGTPAPPAIFDHPWYT